MASWHREAAATQRLLAQNFTEPRWKTAAQKNAFALLGKRRFEYAAAFFLLADAPHDAVHVISEKIGDMQLAIAVARVYEDTNDGTPGPILRKFLQERVLPRAREEGDRYLATWAFWMLGQRDKAVRALVTPLSHVIPSDGPSGSFRTPVPSRPSTPATSGSISRAVSPAPPFHLLNSLSAANRGSAGDFLTVGGGTGTGTPTSTLSPQLRHKLFLTDDPALAILYTHLRPHSLQTLRGAVQATRNARHREWDFVLHTARLYARMGCDHLALDLVRSWEFLEAPAATLLGRPAQPNASKTTAAAAAASSQHQHQHQQRVDGLVDAVQGLSVNGVEIDPRRLLKRRGSLVRADLPAAETVRSPVTPTVTVAKAVQEEDEESGDSEESGDEEKGEEEKPQEKPRPPPTQFVEPSANSLLDSFGF
jgi:hypothetical protein